MYYKVRHYQYKNRIGNLKAEAVGVVSGEKHFPIFPGNMIFKPLTKSKPFSTPLYAYAEVFWSTIINEYFMPAPRYELAICEGYEAVNEKYLDYGTAVPMAYKEGEYLLNLLEFFRKYPDEKVDIDNYVNYCQMFYDYRDIFEADFLQEHQEMAEQLAMQVLISVLKGDQNYHYENVAFLCDKDGGIISLAPMIDHEFSTYFMFPDDVSRHVYWLMELSKSIRGWEVRPGEYDNFKDPEERKLMEKSATCIHKNLLYIKEHYPQTTEEFLDKAEKLKTALTEASEDFLIRGNTEYPDCADSSAWLIGKARYKDKDEEKASAYEILSLQSTSDQTDYLYNANIAANVASAVTPEQGGMWVYPYEDEEEHVIYNVVNGMLLRPYISGMVWKLGENSMNRMKEGISLYKEIREEVRDGVPFFPLGFGTLKSEVLAYGVKAEKNTYLSVWTPGTTEAVIPLENAEQVRRVSVIYPKEEMCGYKIENGNLVVKMPQEKAARLFKIEMK